MEPRESLVSKLRSDQQAWDDEHPSPTEVETIVADKVQKARSIAETVAHFNGGHTYSGRDTLNRDYYSKWVTVNLVQSLEDVFLQARLTREYEILGEGQMETGMRFKNVGIDVRLLDSRRKLYSPTDVNLYTFSKAGVTKKTDTGLEDILPRNPEWTEIDGLLDQLNTALADDPQQK